MSMLLYNLKKYLFGEKRVNKIMVMGIEDCGKSTLLLKLCEATSTISNISNKEPTNGFNLEIISINDIEFEIWDIGGSFHNRLLKRHYLSNDNIIGILFCINLKFINNDNYKKQLESSKQEFDYLKSNNDLKTGNFKILLMDISSSSSSSLSHSNNNGNEITTSQDYSKIIQDLKLYLNTIDQIQIFKCNNINDINDCLNWIHSTFKN